MSKKCSRKILDYTVNFGVLDNLHELIIIIIFIKRGIFENTNMKKNIFQRTIFGFYVSNVFKKNFL
jgi:hypothetical protein